MKIKILTQPKKLFKNPSANNTVNNCIVFADHVERNVEIIVRMAVLNLGYRLEVKR